MKEQLSSWLKVRLYMSLAKVVVKHMALRCMHQQVLSMQA